MNVTDISYEHQQAIEAMKSQLLIAFVRRLGGTVSMPVAEIDGTGPFNLTLKVDAANRVFTFTVEEK